MSASWKTLKKLIMALDHPDAKTRVWALAHLERWPTPHDAERAQLHAELLQRARGLSALAEERWRLERRAAQRHEIQDLDRMFTESPDT